MADSKNTSRQVKKRQESGQSTVEFALVLMFIILPLVFGFIEGSVLLYKYVALSNAAREGARAGSIYLYVGDPYAEPCVPGSDIFCGPDGDRNAAVVTAVSDTVGPLMPGPPDCSGSSSTTTCQISYGASSAPIEDPLRSTDMMTVAITHTHSYLFGALGNDIDIQARSSMRIEPSTVITP
jgi:hypothetical protein